MSWRVRLPRDVGVVIVAAGHGRRMGGTVPKQFLPLGGVPMVLRAIRPFISHPDVAEVVLVLPVEHSAAPPPWLAEMRTGILAVVPGGEERTESVAAGLSALSAQCEVVLVHDGARPLVDRDTIDRVIAGARAWQAVTAAIPLTDTLKKAKAGHPPVIAETVPRAGLWRAQTPQGFMRRLLEDAHAAARKDGRGATDDAELVERLGVAVRIVEGSLGNLKITTAEDFALAAAVLEASA